MIRDYANRGTLRVITYGNPVGSGLMRIISKKIIKEDNKIEDLTNKKFGRLTILEFVYRKNGRNYWKCKCDCGSIVIKNEHNLKNGDTKSCGCLHRDITKKIKTTHGERHTRLYRIWSNMKSRCYNSNVSCYERYGGKGIHVCDEWMKYENFSKWAKSHGYKDDLTIERINPTGNYCPENCEWISFKENCSRAGQKSCWGLNLITGEYIEFKNIKKFSEEHGFSRKCIDRVLHGRNKTHKNWIFGYLDH